MNVVRVGERTARVGGIPITAERPTRARTARASGAPELPRIWHLFADDAVLPRLLLLAKMIERITSRQLQSEWNMSVAQWRVLAFVCISGPATAAHIGEAAEVDQAEISRAVQALVQRGLATREFLPGSRKKLIIAPTADGTKQFKLIRKIRQAYFKRMTGRLAPAEKIGLSRMLSLIADELVAERQAINRSVES